MRATITLLAMLLLLTACETDPTNGLDDEEAQQDGPVAEPEPEPEPEPTGEKMLRVSVTDETTAWQEGSSGLPDIEIWIRGTGSWFPDTSFGSDVLEEAGPFPVGEPTEFYIYTDGRDQPEFAIAVLVDEDIIEASVRDMINVTVDDTTVTVTGTPIPDFEVVFTR